MRRLILAIPCLLLIRTLTAQTALPTPPPTKTITCDDPASGCLQTFVNGFPYRTLATSQAVVTVSLADNGKYTRMEVGVTNAGQQRFDVLPSSFAVAVTAPKAKVLHLVPLEKIISSERHSAGWANALNAMGAGMATQQVSTQTNSSGTVQATGGNGTSASGTYNENSTSTTSVPNYAAQARARENIARRRQAIQAHEVQLEQTVLRSNTVEVGKSISGFIFFEGAKHGENYTVDIPIDGITYHFNFPHPKH